MRRFRYLVFLFAAAFILPGCGGGLRWITRTEAGGTLGVTGSYSRLRPKADRLMARHCRDAPFQVVSEGAIAADRVSNHAIQFTCGGAVVEAPPVDQITIVPLNADRQVFHTATVQMNGDAVGTGSVTVARVDRGLVTVSGGPGYLPATVTIGQNSPAMLEVMLLRDELWDVTVADSNQIIGRWLSMTPSERSASDGTWWSVIVAAMAGQDFEMEMMDEGSGFVRTAWKERSYGSVRVRRRFVGNVVTESPLVWRVKYSVETLARGQRDWTAYDRGFADELDVIQEIRSRFGAMNR